MSLEGKAAANAVLRGRINGLDTLTISAYGIAVKNGFEGTEEEWLASLKGDPGYTPVKGVDYVDGKDGKDATDEQVAAAVAAYMEGNHPATIGEVTLLASAWVGNASPYSQVVEIDGVTENSQVDLTPSVAQLAVFHHKDLAFVTENVDGVVTVYAIGDKPLNDYTIQVTITEVYV